MTWLYQKYRLIAKSISPLDISSDFSQKDLGWDDILFNSGTSNTTNLFLGKYSKDGIKLFIRRFGLDKKIRHLGIRELSVRIDTKDPYRHILTVYSGTKEDKDHIIMELVARYQHLEPKKEDSEFLYTEPLKVLMVEWLLLQNPAADFKKRRPRLPGQGHPGLGMGDELLALFSLMGRHLKVDGILNVPQYFHTALFFSKRSLFLSPFVQSKVTKITRDLWKKYPISVIAWASATGSIINVETGELFQWEPRKQILPLKPQLKQYFKSDMYQDIAQRVNNEILYSIDEDKLRQALEGMDNPPFKI